MNLRGFEDAAITPSGERYVPYHCVHCRRPCGNVAGGFARVQGRPVCSHPADPTRPDCYANITTKAHPLEDCSRCRPKEGGSPPCQANANAQRSSKTRSSI